MLEKGTYTYSISIDADKKKLEHLIDEIKDVAKYVHGEKNRSFTTELFVMRGSNILAFRRFNDENSTIKFSYTKNAFYDPIHLPFIMDLCNREAYSFEPKQQKAGPIQQKGN